MTAVYLPTRRTLCQHMRKTIMNIKSFPTLCLVSVERVRTPSLQMASAPDLLGTKIVEPPLPLPLLLLRRRRHSYVVAAASG